MLKFSLRIASRTLKLLRRIALGVVLLLIFVSSGLILGLRYWVLPDIERYHTDIAAAASKAIGLEVEIGKIEADWHGLGPRLSLTEIRILDKQKRATLALQKVDLVVSWMTLFTGQPRLASLEIDQPDLMVKRDSSGVLQISGVPLGGDSADNNFANMLLNQSKIIVRDARISWLDEQRGKPLLVFDQVNLRIENIWNYHRFAMHAMPPEELSTKLDVRGDFYGIDFDDQKSWSGEIFTQLDYANLPAWKAWLPLPDALKSGSGALRGWLGVEEGKISQVTADLALLDVKTRLAADLPPLDIRVLSGRMGWREVHQGFEFSTRQLSLKLFNDFVLQPSDIFVRLSNDGLPGSVFGEVRANLLELEGVAHLMEYVPLEPKFKKRFAEFSPKGRVEKLQASWSVEDKQLRYEVAGRFGDLSLQRVGALPGFSGLSGEVEGSDRGGSLFIQSRNLTADAPQLLHEPLSFDFLNAEANWVNKKDEFSVTLRNASLSNPDLVATLYGNYQTVPNSPGKLDLNAHLTRAALPHVRKYIPKVALGEEVQHWLGEALLGGESNDASLRIKGDLNDFPYADNQKGIFKVHARGRDVNLAFMPEWPRIEHGNAELLIQGSRLAVTAKSATTEDIKLKNVSVVIPDILHKDLMLLIEGSADAENALALKYIGASPVRGYLDGFTDNIVAQGSGKLNLKLEIPLRGEQQVKVAGKYHFLDSEIDFSPRLPSLRKVNGDLLFSESGASTTNIVANILGGPAKLLIENDAQGAMKLRLEGRANLASSYVQNPHPLLSKLSGDPAWNVQVDVQNKKSKILFSSNLKGLQSDLPAPFNKLADESVPVKFELVDVSTAQQQLSMQYGSLFNANIFSRLQDGSLWEIERGILNFGNVEQSADRNGLWVIGTLPHVSIEGWGVLASVMGDEQTHAPINLGGIDCVIQKVTGYGNTVNDLHIKAANRGGILMAQLASKEVKGDLSWRSNDSGRLVARFKNLDLTLEERELAAKSLPDAFAQPHSYEHLRLPVVDLSIERLSLNGRQLGKLDFLAQQQDELYQLDYLRLMNPDGLLTVDGKWNMSQDAPQTQVNVKLDITNAGNVLARSGFPNAVKNGSGTMQGTFAWPGAPVMFSKDRVNGSLALDTGKGQFLQIDPGIGKLLSILSLQALPKRITLDFEDVFSKGFEFDKVSGTADIKQGVIFTDNLKIEGSAAKVAMQGQMNLNNETQNMRVRIVPTVGNSAALLSALVATPVVGAGVFIASKILNDPLGQLVSFEYNISGNWADPKVEKVVESKSAK